MEEAGRPSNPSQEGRVVADAPKRITIKIPTEVTAFFLVHPEWGPERSATAEDLAKAGYHHHQAMYERFRHLCGAMGIEDPADDERWNFLRYFIEYVTTYSHDMDPDDLERFRRMIDSATLPDPDTCATCGDSECDGETHP